MTLMLEDILTIIETTIPNMFKPQINNIIELTKNNIVNLVLKEDIIYHLDLALKFFQEKKKNKSDAIIKCTYNNGSYTNIIYYYICCSKDQFTLRVKYKNMGFKLECINNTVKSLQLLQYFIIPYFTKITYHGLIITSNKLTMYLYGLKEEELKIREKERVKHIIHLNKLNKEDIIYHIKSYILMKKYFYIWKKIINKRKINVKNFLTRLDKIM